MQSGESGFTLMEMLIGITLMALLMVAVLMGLRVATKAWQKGEDRISLIYGKEERGDFVAKQVASLVPYKVSSHDPKLPGEFVILEAKPSCLRFLTTYGSRYRNRSGLVLAEYGLVPAARGKEDLCLREAAVENDKELLRQIIQSVGPDPDTGQPRIVYRPFIRNERDLRLWTDVQAARFEYLFPATQKEEAHWVSDWQPALDAEFPLAVRLSWVQDGRQEKTVFPIRANSLPQ
jgi:prepilin-type N-terminal cleavage/methylation domain-containing protein